MSTDLQRQVLSAVEQLQVGEVVSFGDVAARAGHPAAARAVGRILAVAGETYPWWRVVYADGHLPPCNPTLQAERLSEEGVSLRGLRVTKSSKGRFSDA